MIEHRTHQVNARGCSGCRDEENYNYQAARRWTLPKKLKMWGQASPSILELDKVIMPVHLGIHWTCAVIDLRSRTVIYLDSLKVCAPALCPQCRMGVPVIAPARAL